MKIDFNTEGIFCDFGINFFSCFQNDIENVFPFVFLGFLYISTNPTLAGAKLAFRIFTAARFLHSIVYVFAVSNTSSFRTLGYRS